MRIVTSDKYIVATFDSMVIALSKIAGVPLGLRRFSKTHDTLGCACDLPQHEKEAVLPLLKENSFYPELTLVLKKKEL